MEPLEAEDCDTLHAVTIEDVEDEQFITVHHPMTKGHFISFLAWVTTDRLQLVKLYPEDPFAAAGYGPAVSLLQQAWSDAL